MQQLANPNRGIFRRAVAATQRGFTSVKNMAATAMLALSLAMIAPAFAGGGSAANDLGDAATAQLSGAQGIVIGILVTMIGIVFCFVVYSLIRRAAGK